MRKLLVTCDCGQQMQVPRSAIGKMGVCPTCGRTTRITKKNTSGLSNRARKSSLHRKPPWSTDGSGQPSEEAKQLFGRAVDHFYAQRYAESLAIFDALAREFSGNPDIVHARATCEAAMRRPALPEPDAHEDSNDGELTSEEVKRFITDKLRYGANEEIQMRAAELACRYFGFKDEDLEAGFEGGDVSSDSDSDPGVEDDEEAASAIDGAASPDEELFDEEEEAPPPNRVSIFPTEEAR